MSNDSCRFCLKNDFDQDFIELDENVQKMYFNLTREKVINLLII